MMGNREFSIAVVGATGAVGLETLKVLGERSFPAKELRPLASSRSAGTTVEFRGANLKVEELRESSFAGIDIAIFCAGGSVSAKFAPVAVEAGAVVIDKTSHFRLDPNVPLVVPEVNPEAIAWHKGIISNPNCSTIQLVCVLKPIHDAATIKRVVCSTYQSVSGAGKRAMDELGRQVEALFNSRDLPIEVFPAQIAFNCIPHIDEFGDDGYCKEETKMIEETKKILDDPSMRLTMTTVRVPVFCSHSEAVNIEMENKLTREEARRLLEQAPGITVQDDPERNVYPLAVHATGKDDVFVGRIREDPTVECGLNLWIVSDNLRKGAATNGVQLAELLVEKHF